MQCTQSVSSSLLLASYSCRTLCTALSSARVLRSCSGDSRYYSIPLVVGRRIAQIVFFATDAALASSYEESGKYQTTASQEELTRSWRPEAMLPKMYYDRECTATQTASRENSGQKQARLEEAKEETKEGPAVLLH